MGAGGAGPAGASLTEVTRFSLTVAKLAVLVALSRQAGAAEPERTDLGEPAPAVSPRRAQRPAAVDARPSVWGRRLVLYWQLSPLGGPIGFSGVSAEYAPAPLVSFEAGAGAGLGGAQGALMAHLKVSRGRSVGGTLGAGASMGNYLDVFSYAVDFKTHGPFAVWAHAEMGVEERTDGSSQRVTLGLRHHARIT